MHRTTHKGSEFLRSFSDEFLKLDPELRTTVRCLEIAEPPAYFLKIHFVDSRQQTTTLLPDAMEKTL